MSVRHASRQRATHKRQASNHAAALTDDHELIRIDANHRIARAAGPGDLDPICAFLRGLSNRVLELGGESGTEAQPHLYPGSYVEYVERTGHEAPGVRI